MNVNKTLCLLVFLCSAMLSARGQADVNFWFVAPEVSQTGSLNLDRPMFLRLTAFSVPATVTISQPAGGGMPATTIPIAANSTVSFDLTPWINIVENKPANTILNYGIQIQSTAPISAYYSVVSGACLCNPEDFVLKGRNALGTDFWIPGQNTLNNDPSYSPIPYNAFDIVATQNGTTVTITPAQNIVGHTAGTPFTVTLNQGQTYSATATSTIAANHLVGSRVTSNKPIAITEKDDLLAYTSLGIFGADLIGDQIVPTNVCGTEYIPMYGNLTAPGDQLFITATQPGTTVSVNGTLVSTIATAGGTYQMTCPSPSCYIQTNYPVYVYQLSGIHSEVGSALLPQINCTGSNSVSIQQSSTIDFQVNLLVKTVGTGGFLVNGLAGVVTPAMFTVVPGTGGVWSCARVTLPVATYPIGTVLTISNASNLFQMGYLSSGPPNSGASFGYFSNYGGINPNPTTTTPSLCAGDSIRLYADTITGATYLWTGPGGFTSTLQNPFISGAVVADSGVYQIVVNTPGCTDTATINIAVHVYPQVSLGNDTVSCNGVPVTLQSAISIPPAATYVWSTGATSSSIVVTTSGTYWLTADNSGCKASDTVHVTIDPVISPNVSYVTHLGCYSDEVDFTNLNINARSYSWDFGDGSAPDTSHPYVSHVYTAQGVYTVTVTARTLHCEHDTTLTIDTRHAVLADFTALPDTLCAGGSTVLTDNSTPTAAIVSRSWNTGDGSSGLTGASLTHTYSNPGVFPVTLTVTDTLGCVDSVTKGVVVLALEIQSLHDTTLCLYQPVPLHNIVQQIPNVGLSNYAFNWSPAIGLNNSKVQVPDFFDFTPMTYSYTVTLQPYGCVATDSVHINPISGAPIENITPTSSIFYGGNLQLNAQGQVIYWWTPDDGSLSNANINNPVAAPSRTTQYTVYGYDVNGCLDSATVLVEVDSSVTECIPTAFTPNGDGKNDVFRPMCITFQRLVDFRIFDRWGQQVFYSNDYKKGWDGTHNGVQQDMGVYFYNITVARPDGENIVYKGDVTLIR